MPRFDRFQMYVGISLFLACLSVLSAGQDGAHKNGEPSKRAEVPRAKSDVAQSPSVQFSKLSAVTRTLENVLGGTAEVLILKGRADYTKADGSVEKDREIELALKGYSGQTDQSSSSSRLLDACERLALHAALNKQGFIVTAEERDFKQKNNDPLRLEKEHSFSCSVTIKP